MTARELIERLQGMIDDGDCDDDSEVILMTQRNYPMKYSVHGITLQSSETYSKNNVVICEGKHRGYGIERAWHACDARK